jgi:hypothetical protein
VLTGRVRLDLSQVARDKMPVRLSLLRSVPDGAAVVIVVGPCAVEPQAVRVLRLEESRLSLVLEGEPYSVPLWLAAIRDGLGETLV